MSKHNHNQQFDTYEEWVNQTSMWLTRHPDYDMDLFRTVCFDAQGRPCRIGADFTRARDEGTFPVRWIWPDQLGPIINALECFVEQWSPSRGTNINAIHDMAINALSFRSNED